MWLAFTLACGPAAPALPTAGELGVLTYNVHGLPPEITGDDTAARMVQIAPLLNRYALVGLQEEFDEQNHQTLTEPSTHAWVSRFGEPLDDRVYGSGLSVLGSAERLEEENTYYEACYGVLEGASDCLASKGFQRLRLRLGAGELDVYNTHMEAGNNPEDDEARVVQVQQLLEALEGPSAGRAVLLMGDTNLGAGDPEDEVFLAQLQDGAGLEDACDLLGCPEPGRIDRFLLRSGAGLELTPLEWRVDTDFVDEQGVPLSDHDAIAVVLGWAVEG